MYQLITYSFLCISDFIVHSVYEGGTHPKLRVATPVSRGGNVRHRERTVSFLIAGNSNGKNGTKTPPGCTEEIRDL
jgi:hypothetical protein